MSGSPSLRIWLLGTFRVAVEGRAVPDAAWRLRKAKHLLKLLALEPAHRLHRERVLELLWPDLDPSTAANNLRYALHTVRRILEPDHEGAPRYVRLRDEHVVLDDGVPTSTDLAEFRAAAAEALAIDDPGASERALALYSGDLLPEDVYEDWAAGPREEVREFRLTLLRHLARLHGSAGELAGAISAYERIVAVEPTEEPAHAALIRLHAEHGDRARALRQYDLLARTLREELDLEPQPTTRRLRDDVAAGRLAPIETSPPRRHNIPGQLTSFVGRGRDISEVTHALGAARLVTLTGLAGSGKTRLGLAVAERSIERMADGVWVVDLSSLGDGALLAQAVARALRVRLRDGLLELAAWLDGRELLLVLDGCEHLAGEVAALATTLLRECPRLRVLATSRVTLGMIGELVYDVPPLDLPPADAGPEQLVAFDAVRLFVERAAMVRSGFALTPSNARAVVDICRRLDGLPLALELAAARTRALPLEQIASRIDAGEDGTDAGARGMTVRRAIVWSHGQLDPAGRALFERVAMFRAWWTLEAAEAIASDDPLARRSVADIVQRLVERSLVSVDLREDGSVRYRMLETVRAFAAERLRASGEERSAAARHARYFLARAEAVAPELVGARQIEVLDRLSAEHDDLRAALRWYVTEGDAEGALRLVRALAPFWSMRGHYQEGLERAAEVLDIAREPTALRAAAALAAGSLAAGCAMNARARDLFAEARAIFERLGDRGGLASVLQESGMLAVVEGRLADARALHEGSLAIRKELGDAVGLARSLVGLANLARYEEAWPAAREFCEASLQVSRSLGDRHGELVALMHLATIDHMEHDLPAANAKYEEALQLARAVGDRVWEARISTNLALLRLEQGAPGETRALLTDAFKVLCQGYGHALTLALEDVAALAAARGRFERACRLAGAAAASREAIGEVPTPVRQAALDAWLPVARAALAARADAAWEEGRHQRLPWAVAEAERLLAEPLEAGVRWPPPATRAGPSN